MKKYCQMSGGRFLVGFSEVVTSENFLQMRSLLKANFYFWKLDLKLFNSNVNLNSISELFNNDTQECE